MGLEIKREEFETISKRQALLAVMLWCRNNLLQPPGGNWVIAGALIPKLTTAFDNAVMQPESNLGRLTLILHKLTTRLI